MPRKMLTTSLQHLSEFGALSLLRPALHALIAPQAVVVETGAGARPLLRQLGNPCSTAEEQFGAAVVDLLQLIDDPGLHGRRLHVVVSDFWARPLVLPLQGKLPSDEEIDVVLQSHYRRTYGDLMDDWHWCWVVQDARLVAVAWPTAGLAALREGIAQRGCVLASAKPVAIDVASKVELEGVSSWLAIMEWQSVTLVRQQGGVWQDWCVMPGDADTAESLPLQLARESARRRDDCRTVTIVDLNGTTNLTLIRKTLVDAGWLVHLHATNETSTSLACRLSLAITSGTST